MPSYCTCPIEDYRDYPGPYCLVCGKETFSYWSKDESDVLLKEIIEVLREKEARPKIERNRIVAEEAADSAFYYGNLSVEEWIVILHRLLDDAYYAGKESCSDK